MKPKMGFEHLPADKQMMAITFLRKTVTRIGPRQMKTVGTVLRVWFSQITNINSTIS